MKPLKATISYRHRVTHLLSLAEFSLVVEQLQGVEHVLHGHKGVCEVLLTKQLETS